MARDFDGSTDRIDFANVYNPSGAACTVSAWIYPHTGGGGDGYFAHIGETTTEGTGVWFRTWGTNQYVFGRLGSTAKYRTSNTNLVDDNIWQHVLTTDPDTDFTDATEISIYKNGTEVDYAAAQNGSSESQFGGYYNVGARYSDDLRNFDGYVAEVAWWDRVLNAAEIAMLTAAYSALFIMNGLRFYAPLIRDLVDRTSGNVGTLDGTTIAAHPRIIYPMPSMLAIPTAVADAMPMAMDHYHRMRM